MALHSTPLKGFAVTFRHLLPQAGHGAVPRVQATRVPALPRTPPPAPARERAREVHRLLALRRRLPGRLHPRRRRRERPENRVSPGERYARIYEINMARCIFCGYCEIACPFDAITLGNDYELSELIARRADLHQGDAARAAGAPHARAGSGGVRPRRPGDRSDGVLGMYRVYAHNADKVPQS